MVEASGASTLRKSQAVTNLCRFGWEQRQPESGLEVLLARVCRRVWFGCNRVPLSTRNQQMEQDRASDVLLHQFELARTALGELPDGCELDRRHANQDRTQGKGEVGSEGI